MLTSSARSLSLSTACLFPLPVRRIISLAAKAGYDGIELEAGGRIDAAAGERIREWAASAGIAILSVHQALMDPRTRREPGVIVTNAIDLAAAVGAPVVVLHSPWETDWNSQGSRVWLASLDEAQRRAVEAGLCITVENMGEHPGMPGRLVLGELSDLVEFARRHDLHVTYDTCHAGTLSSDLVADLVALGDRLANVHLSDHKPGSIFRHTAVLDLVFSNHQMPGEGKLDLVAFLQALAETPYDRAITFEVSPTALGSILPCRRMSRMAQARRFVREALESGEGTSHVRAAVSAAPAE